MSLMRHLQLRMYFTKLDISNMFYTCRTPQGCDSGIRVQIGDDVYGFPGLPFGWAHSPALAQELLGMYLSVQHPRQVKAIQYLDDVLMFSTDRGLLQQDSHGPAQSVERAGWIVSPKSELTPTPEIQWMGKRINGTDYTISPEPEYMASLLVVLVALLTKGYHQQRLQRRPGRILWASRPGNTTMPFLAGAYPWLQCPPPPPPQDTCRRQWHAAYQRPLPSPSHRGRRPTRPATGPAGSSTRHRTRASS